jgi:tRNA threonylcarbamoyl adenosine modification protein YjeE
VLDFATVAERELALANGDATRALGRALARAAHLPGMVIALEGPLGAGKTSLAKAFIAAVCGVSEDDVPSPTFTLVNEYVATPPILHVDAYRLASPRDFEDLGYGALDASGRTVLVEWSSRVLAALPEDRIDLELDHAPEGRRARIIGRGPRSNAVVSGLDA